LLAMPFLMSILGKCIPTILATDNYRHEHIMMNTH
jgi:hypothetical protein